ncbi:MAG: pantetheine-phosphate adenylyltransferase [Clostridia bacterium]|nr:pantetheine-phosphate adenylyltransferase [Clostridia bacterium]
MDRQTKAEKRIGVFPGSFDPITVGHIDIIKRASAIFDTLYVAVSDNIEKKYLFDLGTRCRFARESLQEVENVIVTSSDVLTAEFARAVGALSLVKGVRSVKDFEDERRQADINYALGGAETILLFSRPEYSYISSSLIRELLKYGKPVDKFVSPYIFEEILRLTKK